MAGQILLDNIDISTYGVFAVRGSYDDFVRMPDMKEPSLFSWETENFDDVDLTSRKIASRDITLTFLMSADTVEDLMDKRAQLRTALTADGYRNLYIATLDKTFELYYKGSDKSTFINGSKYRIKMPLRFRLNSF